ncbi:sigma-70 family RNA polymerase sigma factor [Paenibacillus tianjinensis]|uniref:Sigma-70 family RNA polymerase sigma factor n=1 Tax=Paenibacillus tianjinensis TaxID=2810347 RepID=A0ABX7L5J8_9BACL|nr:sigma-70 family RNA polymerase sigma factor [Paenibacillus tianjinensis]QSF43362.1 sigma-70 family RNA polymerase sigma factor [Paenibacillus tianjinensis]
MNLKRLKRDPNFNNEEAIIEFRKTQNNELREKFFENNYPLVQQLANKWFNKNNSFLTYDDLLSYGFEGMLKAFNSYAPEKGIKLISFITLCIEREYIKALSKQKYKGRNKYNIISLNEKTKVDKNGGREKYLEEIVGDNFSTPVDEEAVSSAAITEFEYIASKCLSERDRQVAYKFFIEGKTFEEIGQEVGISKQRAHQIHRKNIEKLKSELDDEVKISC